MIPFWKACCYSYLEKEGLRGWQFSGSMTRDGRTPFLHSLRRVLLPREWPSQRVSGLLPLLPRAHEEMGATHSGQSLPMTGHCVSIWCLPFSGCPHSVGLGRFHLLIVTSISKPTKMYIAVSTSKLRALGRRDCASLILVTSSPAYTEHGIQLTHTQ